MGDAKGLLYGRRHSGSGPAGQTKIALSLPETFVGLGREEALDGLIDVTTSLGLSQQQKPSDRIKMHYEVAQQNELLTIDIRQPGDQQLRLVARLGGDDKTVGAYYIDTFPGADVVLKGDNRLKETKFDSVGLMRDKLKELGVKRFASIESTEDILARLDKGEAIELDNGRGLLNGQTDEGFRGMKQQAKNIINFARMESVIDGNEEASLAGLIDGLSQGDNALRALAETETGQKVIKARDWLYISEPLN